MSVNQTTIKTNKQGIKFKRVKNKKIKLFSEKTKFLVNCYRVLKIITFKEQNRTEKLKQKYTQPTFQRT